MLEPWLVKTKPLEKPRDKDDVPIKRLGHPDIEKTLNKLFDAWPSAAAYSYFILELPVSIDFALWLNMSYDDLRSDKPLRRKYYAGVKPEVAGVGDIGVFVPSSMEIEKDLPRAQRFCVDLDGFQQVRLPWAAAQIVSAGFCAGLVARLVLEALLGSDANLSECDLLSRNKDLPNWIRPPLSRPFNEWVTDLSSRVMLPAAGLFKGWCFGGLLTKDGGPPAIESVWQLLKHRFSWSQLGELTGYTLDYSLGFARRADASEKLFNDAQREQRKQIGLLNLINKIPTEFAKDLHDSMAYQEKNREVAQLFDALIDLGRDRKMPHQIVAFLKGYQRGTQRSSEAVFALALQLGYGVGYVDGYEVGYARGYADGYRAGYDDGHSQTIADIRKILEVVVVLVGKIQGLPAVLDKIEEFIDKIGG